MASRRSASGESRCEQHFDRSRSRGLQAPGELYELAEHLIAHDLPVDLAVLAYLRPLTFRRWPLADLVRASTDGGDTALALSVLYGEQPMSKLTVALPARLGGPASAVDPACPPVFPA
jgi:hypothetical protein